MLRAISLNCLPNQICQIDKFLHRQLLRAFVEDFVVDNFWTEHRAQRVTHGLAALVEGLLDDAHKQFLVAAQVGDGIAPHLDDRRFHLGRRVEDILMHREQVVDVVPSLHQYAQDTVGLAAFLGCHSFCHFLLHHTHHLNDLFLVFQHLKENLATDVVREIPNDGHVLLPELAEVGAKEVALNQPLAEHGEMFLQIGDGLLVDFDDMELVEDVLYQILGQHTRASTHLDDALHIGRQLLDDALGYALVGQEMLA